MAYADRRFEEAVGEYDRAIALGTPEKEYAQYKRAVTLGILGRTEQKQQALRQIEAAGGDYADEASYELGRSYIAQEKYAEGAAQLERFVAKYPSSPRVMQAWSDLGLAYLNLGDKQKSLACYDRVVGSAPQSSEARDAMQSIREIYVSEGDVDAYFEYAARAGVESDLTALSRDSLSFAAARKLYLDGDREAATRSLRNYVESYPKGSYRTDALYYLSDCYLVADDRERAIETLTELAEQGTTQYTVPVLEKPRRDNLRGAALGRVGGGLPAVVRCRTEPDGREDAMTGYVRATVAGGDASKIAAMAADVAACKDAGTVALRESKYALATQLREAGRCGRCRETLPRTGRGGAHKGGFRSRLPRDRGDIRRGGAGPHEQEVFAFSERDPQPYWLAKAYLLLGEVYVRKGDTFQARATWQSVADGYSPAMTESWRRPRRESQNSTDHEKIVDDSRLCGGAAAAGCGAGRETGRGDEAYVPKVESALKLAVEPDMTDTTRMRPEIDYTVTPLSLRTTLTTRPIRPATVTYWEFNRPLPFYLKVGAGYPLNSVVDFYATTQNPSTGYVIGYVNHEGSYSKIANEIDAKNNSTRMYNRAGVAAGSTSGATSSKGNSPMTTGCTTATGAIRRSRRASGRWISAATG